MSVHPVGAQSPGGCWAIAGGATSWCCPPPSLTLSSGGGDCDPAWRVKVGSQCTILLSYPHRIQLSYSSPTIPLSYYPPTKPLLQPPVSQLEGNLPSVAASPALHCLASPHTYFTHGVFHKVHYIGPCIFHNALPSTGWYTPLCKLF